MFGRPWLWERCHGREVTMASVIYVGKINLKKNCNVTIGMISVVESNVVGDIREFLVENGGDG